MSMMIGKFNSGLAVTIDAGRNSLLKSMMAAVALFALVAGMFSFAITPMVQADDGDMTILSVPHTQNFDTLPASGSATWTNNSTIPGWFHARTGTGNTVIANDGSSNAGNLYSYGTGTATDRALGSIGSSNAAVGNLFWGYRVQNNTGQAITSLNVSYVGEQWRNSASAAQTVSFSYLVGLPTVTGSLAEFQSAGVSVPQLDFTSPITGGTAGALNGNLAANRVAITHTITGLNIPNGTEVMLRWSDPDHTGADHGLAIDDFSVTATTGGGQPTLSINDVSLDEGNAGTTAFTFNVTLSSAAGPGGVTFDIATADGTAQDDNPTSEDNDYVARSLTSQTIPAGSTGPYAFTVSVNGDTVSEPNETFFVNVTNITGATAGDAQGLGTINNDDITVTPIHDIQGNGAASPIVGATVTTTGIVTLLRTGSNAGSGAANGFFLQSPDADADADPNTSQGIFVFTNAVPTVGVGDRVRVTGTVVEFNGLTEISSPISVAVLSTGNTLPTAITLTAADLPASGPVARPQLEKYECMRLTAPSLTTVAPNDPFFDVYAVLPGVLRPVREPGIPVTDPIPPDPITGLPDPNIAIWDENPERLKVDTNGRAGAPNVAYTSNVTFTGPAGPLDFAFDEYRLVLDAAPAATANMSAVPAPTPTGEEFTVAGYNIENFNNNATQRVKASQTIRTLMHYPDVVGVAEIFDLADLQALATQVNNDAIAAGDPNPLYQAYLIEQDGTSEDNDQDVGYLVRSSRVAVNSVVQYGQAETFINPNTGLPEVLHDRPPLVLDARVDPTGENRRVLVIVNHTRSFIDVELVSGEGIRVREKRKKQAESIAAMLQSLQSNNAGVPVIAVGDYNAFQFSSGYDDSLSVIKGTPTSSDQIVVAQSPDLVEPNFRNLIDELPALEQYTFMFDGTPQALDHVIVNDVVVNARLAIVRVNADFPDAPPAEFETNPLRPERNSDHDPVIAYFPLAGENGPPDARDDNAAVGEDSGANTINVLANDTDPDQDPLTVTAVTQGANGAVAITNNGADVSYTPNINFNGSDSFTYTISDGNGGEDTATVTVTINAVNDAPVITTTPGTSATEGQQFSYDADSTDVDGPQAIWSLATPAHTCGGSINASTGVFTFTPPGNPPASCVMSIRVCDAGSPEECSVQTATIQITALNDPPTINAATGITRTQGAGPSVSQIATVGDPDDAANTLTVTVNNGASATVNGVTVSNIIVNANGTVNASVSAACGATNASFTLRVTDPSNASATATLSVSVVNETTPPVIGPIQNVVAFLPPNSSATSMPVSFPLPTATDNCGGPVTVTTNPVSGSVFQVGNTTVTVTATDSAGNVATTTFTVSVRYNFTGFFSRAVNPPGTNFSAAGNTIPISFSLSGDKGLNIFAAGSPSSQQVNCMTGTPIGASSPASSAGLIFFGGQYTYYWTTNPAWAGTCRGFSLTLKDGTTRTLNFSFYN
jgi:uncharacterized protein